MKRLRNMNFERYKWYLNLFEYVFGKLEDELSERNGAGCKLHLTHDVDGITRKLNYRYKARAENSRVKKLYFTYKSLIDSNDCYFESWIETYEKYDFRAVWLFNLSDLLPDLDEPLYKLSDTIRYGDRNISVEDLIDELRKERGFKIGLHADKYIHSYNKNYINSLHVYCTKFNVKHSRSHRLRLSEGYFKNLESLKIEIDYTICNIVPIFGKKRLQYRTTVKIVPTIFMDYTAFDLFGMNSEDVYRHVTRALQVCIAQNAECALLFHPVDDAKKLDTYQKILDYIHSNDRIEVVT